LLPCVFTRFVVLCLVGGNLAGDPERLEVFKEFGKQVYVAEKDRPDNDLLLCSDKLAAAVHDVPSFCRDVTVFLVAP
jgi:hypothetical protein